MTDHTPLTDRTEIFGTVWVLDVIGYDARGGNAQVFSTQEKAMAADPGRKWGPPDDDGWISEIGPGSNSYGWVIYPAVIDGMGMKG